jgi:hypothetical protein
MLVILGSLEILLMPSAHAQGTCTLQEYTLPSTSHLEMIHTSGYVIHLQRASDQSQPTVRVWEQGQFIGEYYIPIDIYDIQVRLEGRYVLETWMGEVRQVYKQVPMAKACAENWTGVEPW